MATKDKEAEMEVTDLSGKELDFWVAHANGITVHPHPDRLNECFIVENEAAEYGFYPYSPSRSWRHAGPIIEREKISIQRVDSEWEASVQKRNRTFRFMDKSPLIAAMKCYVASTLSDAVPDELYASMQNGSDSPAMRMH